MAIANRASILFPLARRRLRTPPNLFDLAFKREKINTKQKALAKGLAERPVPVDRPTCHSRDR